MVVFPYAKQLFKVIGIIANKGDDSVANSFKVWVPRYDTSPLDDLVCASNIYKTCLI
jgi:hypothetical protein